MDEENVTLSTDENDDMNHKDSSNNKKEVYASKRAVCTLDVSKANQCFISTEYTSSFGSIAAYNPKATPCTNPFFAGTTVIGCALTQGGSSGKRKEWGERKEKAIELLLLKGEEVIQSVEGKELTANPLFIEQDISNE
eukprot:13529077-Ditylum_brightwellii.AAC.1